MVCRLFVGQPTRGSAFSGKTKGPRVKFHVGPTLHLSDCGSGLSPARVNGRTEALGFGGKALEADCISTTLRVRIRGALPGTLCSVLRTTLAPPSGARSDGEAGVRTWTPPDDP